VTVLQTQSRFPSTVPGWLPLVEFVMAHWRTLQAERRRRQAIRSPGAQPHRDLRDGGREACGLSPEARAEAELRAAYQMWFGGDTLRGL
jgi:hypothetical protein